MRVGVFSHPECEEHEMGDWHPESPYRLRAIRDQWLAKGVDGLFAEFESTPASLETLSLAHDPDYIQGLQNVAPQTGYHSLDGDTLMNAHTFLAARYSAGCVIDATTKVAQGEIVRAFCLTRPPGHHAERRRALGFCFFNNIALGALHCLKNNWAERVAILDFDVHHGNGTEDIVLSNSNIMLCSVFQYPFFPLSPLRNNTENYQGVPLSKGAGSAEFRQAIIQHWEPALKKFQPEWIFVSAGFDGHRLDPLANWLLEIDDYQWITDKINQWSHKYSRHRIISALEGGYHLPVLAEAATVHLKGLLSSP